jgi:hypothetical protein
MTPSGEVCGHGSEIAEIRSDLSELSGRVGVMEFKVERIDGEWSDIGGNEGFKTKLTKFISAHNTREDMRDANAANMRSWAKFIITTAVALAAILTSVYLALKANEDLHKGFITPPAIFHSQNEPQQAETQLAK